MSSAPYFKFYFSDLAGDTLFLSDAEIGSYVLILGAMWNAGGALPNDPKKLGRIARVTPAKWPARWEAISGFFVVDGDEVTHQRIKSERKKVADISSMRSEIGIAGAEAKALKRQGKAQAIAAEAASNSGHKPESRVQKREKDKPSLSPAAEAAPSARASRRRSLTSIPEGFPDALAMASAEQIVSAACVKVSVGSQARRFRRHAESKGRQERDWSAAWRGWVENEVEKAPRTVEADAPTTSPWAGPVEVIEVFARHELGGYVPYLSWRDVPARAVVTSSPTIHDKLRICADELHDLGVSLIVERGRAVA